MGKFGKAVAAGWKEKHAFVLDEPGFEKYRATCDVQVKHVDKPEDADTRITAQWVPPGAPRLRSSVTGGEVAELDARDVDETETHSVQGIRYARQIGPFDFDSSELTPTVLSSINAFEAGFKRQREPGRPLAGPIEDVIVGFTGRASSQGSIPYNKKLAKARAEAVMDRVMTDLDLTLSSAGSVGEQHASADPKFQRVDAARHQGRRGRRHPEHRRPRGRPHVRAGRRVRRRGAGPERDPEVRRGPGPARAPRCGRRWATRPPTRCSCRTAAA